ncbi:MAG: hypothetical protein L0Y57_10685 [Beijerinckiaceae bacterium]|nr:hypothetical protein [Beijerinckiaceae bacterium]
MNKIVREHYPVSKLPEDLREGLEPGAEVRITMEPDSASGPLASRFPSVAALRRRPERVMTLEEIWALRQPPFRPGEEIDKELRRQRDEWDY